MLEGLMGAGSASRLVPCSTQTLRNWHRRGWLKGVVVDGRLLVLADDVFAARELSQRSLRAASCQRTANK